jgi:AraC family transcriptional regulator of adaptative response / DNA-3-methyladenine glycosylase II
MSPDHDTCYRALSSRDRRFDGRFFTAVQTTGIYCRPICPARTPARRNVVFYPSAAAAESAGFRACRRCRPDAAPGTPEWNGTSAVVSRGLRLISSGALDAQGVPELAARLGVGERHLTRLFVEQIGTTPGAVARTRRAHFARKLIDQTSLPMTEVALASGFRSVRRFNAAFRESFALSPSALRRDRQAGADGASIELQLSYRAPFDWRHLLAFLAVRAIPGREQVRDGVYRRIFEQDGRPGWIEVTHDAKNEVLRLRVEPARTRCLPWIVDRTRRLLDLDADPLAIAAGLSRERRMKALCRRRPGLRVPGAWDGFELAIRAILGQQVSVKGATTLSGRLVARFGAPIEDPLHAGLDRAFPSPEVLARANLETIGMPARRADAIRIVSAAVADGQLALNDTDDPEAARESMMALPGIGPWTTEYVLMRALAQPDAFPASDLGLRAAIDDDNRPGARALEEMSQAWRPWRAYAAMHLWSTLT